MTRGRRALVAGGVLIALALGAWREGPRVYNARRLASFSGRRVYDERAIPAAQVDAALARAQAENKRVLAVIGGNWCQWCLALDDLLTTDPRIRALLDEKFVVVHLDSARAEGLDAAWGHPSRLGVPALVFLDARGTVLEVHDSVSLEALGGKVLLHDRARVWAVLERWS